MAEAWGKGVPVYMIMSLWDSGSINQAELISALGERPEVPLDDLTIPKSVRKGVEELRQAMAEGKATIVVDSYCGR